MKFCIIGDSWAGNKTKNVQTILNKEFAKANHTVDNLADGGASNQGQLRYLEFQYLKHNQADYIIWFYTEPVRNFTEFITLDYGNDDAAASQLYPELTYKQFNKDFSYVATQDFALAQQLYDCYKIPFVVVGGAGVVDPLIDKYTFSNWTLHSWNQEIIQFDRMPINCYTHHLVKMLDKFTEYNKDEALCEMTLLEKLEAEMLSNRQKYPDGRHPSMAYYPLLVERILKEIK
jgi:hypothetical protein